MTGLRKDCTCECHHPGRNIMHAFPCCDGREEQEEDGPQVKLGRVFMSEPLTPPLKEYKDCTCECHDGVMDVHRYRDYRDRPPLCCNREGLTWLEAIYEPKLNETEDPETKA